MPKSWMKQTNLNETISESGQISSQKLVDGYQKHLAKVQFAKGHLTEYWCGCMYALEPVCIL